MKRMLLTGVIAAALFASSAFAASFDVNSHFAAWDGQADISSGSDDVKACSEQVKVDLEYDETSEPTDGDWDVTAVRIRTLNQNECKGYTAQAALELDSGDYVLTDQTATLGAYGFSFTLSVPQDTKVGDVVGVNVIFDKPYELLP